MITPGGIDIVGALIVGLAISGALLWAAALLLAAIEREIQAYFAFNGAWSAERRDGGLGGVVDHDAINATETTGANSGRAGSFAGVGEHG